MTVVAIAGDKSISHNELQTLAITCKTPLLTENISPDYLLYQSSERLELCSQKDRKAGAVYADFIGGKAQHRRLQGGGKGQHIAKAVGLHKIQNPTVLDTTAGLGRDAFILASLGCKVTLLERSPVIHALLNDAFLRLRQSDQTELLSIAQKMTLIHIDAIEHLQSLSDKPDVIYIDPMFPERQKKAQVKKEMRFFHDIAGKDLDSIELLSLARNCANKRIVVKRPRLAETLGNKPANFSITGKSTRYDIYLPTSA